MKLIFWGIIGGLIVTLSFPLATFGGPWFENGSSGFLIFGAFVPFFFALSQSRSFREAMSIGFAFGVTYFLGTLFWVTVAMHSFGYIPLATSIVLMLMLCSYLALYPMIFSGLIWFLKNQLNLSWLLTAPVLWTALEFVRGHLFTGFPWSNIAYSQYGYRPILDLASWAGIYGIDFLMMVVCVSLWQGMCLFIGKETATPAFKSVLQKVWPLAAVVFIGIMNTAAKEWANRKDPGTLQKLRIVLLQGNIPQDEKWLRENEEDIISTYRELTLKANEMDVDLVVWPEASAPRLHLESIQRLPAYLNLPKALSSPLLIGTVNYKGTGENLRLFNSAYYFSEQGNLLGKYHKTHLVPFGEYVPLEKWIPFKKLVAQSGRFTTDYKFTPMEIEGVRFGVLICYETIFPDITRNFMKNQAEFMINITNDAWFGNTSALYQHLSMNAFRAAEHGIPLVRAANTGISAVINRHGRIENQTPVFVKDLLVAEIEVSKNLAPTFYAKTGDLFALINCLFSLVIIECGRRKYRRKKQISCLEV